MLIRTILLRFAQSCSDFPNLTDSHNNTQISTILLRFTQKRICYLNMKIPQLKTQLVSRSNPKGPPSYTPTTTQDQKQICS